MKPTIEDAIILATEAHRGQVDKAGMPYILHPLRVMSAFLVPEDDDARMVAILHDVVEDSAITLEDLLAYGYPVHVVGAVEALTRRDGESYKLYIERVTHDPLGLRVKMADLRDNLNPGRISTAMLASGVRIKYREALEYLWTVDERWRMASEARFPE